MGNALLALALPVVLLEAWRIIRSLGATKAAARDIARSVASVSATALSAMATLSTVAGLCRRLEQEVL